VHRDAVAAVPRSAYWAFLIRSCRQFRFGSLITVLTAYVASLSLTACKASEPGNAETAAINWTKHHVTIRGGKVRNPVPDTPENRSDGEDAFVSYCATCHGNDGQNTGVPFAETMSPPVPSLTDATIQRYTDGQLKWIITNGIWPSGMPASKDVFSDDDMWRMVLYIRHLPAKGSRGEPRSSGGKGANTDATPAPH
jgi:mono/diheme cytochrome c family protein